MERTLINSRYKENIMEHYESEKKYIDYFDDSGLLIVEENAMLLMELINVTTFERTRDVIQVDYKVSEDIQLTILVTREAYQFRLVTTEWTKGSYAPVKTSKLWNALETKGLKAEDLKIKFYN